LKCGEKVYPELIAGARAWIEPLDPEDNTIFVTAKERQDLAKPAGKLKAVVAAVASVLRPGRAVQVSIQDNRWLSDKEALSTPEVVAFQAFVSSLINE
jgi:hypothetical protein